MSVLGRSMRMTAAGLCVMVYHSMGCAVVVVVVVVLVVRSIRCSSV